MSSDVPPPSPGDYPTQPPYGAPGYEASGSGAPGYGAPGAPGYGAPGYGAGGPGYGYPPAYEDPNAKSKLAAGLLGIFLGSLGIHRFYLGYKNVGLTMLLITVLTCGLGSAVTGIWGLVEGILYLTAAPGSKWSVDATGRPLRA